MARAATDMDISREICEQLRQASRADTFLQVRGAGSKPWMLDDSAPDTVSVAGHRGLVSYDPTELVVTVRAGTSLAELDQLLAAQGQMLGAECPDFSGSSTIGGALALGWSGSRQPYVGALRDFVLGCRMVNGLGESLEFGGQVMKNVAGYDISRLLSGSQGQLGVILELSLKLLPLPEREMTLLFEFESLAPARQFARDLLQRGEPVSAASFQAGLLRLRFSGQGKTLDRLGAGLQGQEIDNNFWLDLRRLRLPLFRGGSESEVLYDWNGAVCWSRSVDGAVSRRVGDGVAVDLSCGPPALGGGAGVLAELQQRVGLAFDPRRIFLSARAEPA